MRTCEVKFCRMSVSVTQSLPEIHAAALNLVKRREDADELEGAQCLMRRKKTKGMMERRSCVATSLLTALGTFLSLAYAGEVTALTAVLPGARGGGVRHGVHERDGNGVHLDLVYAFPVQHTDADLYSCIAATQEIDDIPDVLRSLGLLLHSKVKVYLQDPHAPVSDHITQEHARRGDAVRTRGGRNV